MAIDVFSALAVSREFHLSGKEKRFFLWCVLAHHAGYDLGSKRFLTYMQDIAKFSKSRKYIITSRNRLVNKKWLIQTTDSYDIPPLFKGNIKTFKVSAEVEND